MRVVGTRLVARRNRGGTLTFVLEHVNGKPFVISSEWDNPHFVMTIASSRYDQAKRYVKSWWVNLSNYPNVKNTEITFTVPGDDGKPDVDATDYVTEMDYGTGVVTTAEGIYWYTKKVNEAYEWAHYNPPTIVVTFTVQDAEEWLEHTYKWDCSIFVGTLTGKGQGYPPLENIVVVKSLIEDAEMLVGSDSLGGLN